MKISEHFLSVQGEGISAGVPAYFVRMAGCNLNCGHGKSTWVCDSPIWRAGEDYTNLELARLIEAADKQGIIEGRTHIIFTGGEPAMPGTMEQIADFIEFMKRRHRYPVPRYFYEIETNGTVWWIEHWEYFKQINCSPKLSNSGMPWKARYNADAIKELNELKQTWFKFVVSCETDVKEIADFKVNQSKVILMPACTDAQELPERTRFVFEMAKKYHYRAMPRLHILAYNKTMGV